MRSRAFLRQAATLLLLPVVALVAWADNVEELLQKARAALAQGKAQEARTLAEDAIKEDPKIAAAHFLRGVSHEMLGQHTEAIADFSRVLELDPQFAPAYDHRGSEHFKLGHIAESLADFDRYLELQPREKPGHWKRGITLYSAGKFDEGRKQFASYEQVDTNDVENAVWHYLCTARASGVDKARASLLKIGFDRRVPMMQVYDLFAGKLKPEDVLAAVKKGEPSKEELNRRLFYTHLYLGLYYETLGDRKRTLEHLIQADEHKIGHYMWDVAHVHRKLLEKEAK